MNDVCQFCKKSCSVKAKRFSATLGKLQPVHFKGHLQYVDYQYKFSATCSLFKKMLFFVKVGFNLWESY